MIPRELVMMAERDFLYSEIHGYIPAEHATRILPDDFAQAEHGEFLARFREWRRDNPDAPHFGFAPANPGLFDAYMNYSSTPDTGDPRYKPFERMADCAAERRIERALRLTAEARGVDRVHALSTALAGIGDLEGRESEYEGSTAQYRDELLAPRAEGLLTGHAVFDSVVCLEPGQLVIVAGSPSAGKSSFALDALARFAERGLRAEMLSLEMRAGLLRRRLVARATGIPVDVQARKQFSDATREKLLAANEALDALPLKITKSAGWDVDRIAARIMHSPARVLAIDYVGLVAASAGSNRGAKTADIVAAISRAIMQATVASGKLVVLLAQLNREGYKADAPPRMEHLKDSGALEADAHVIIGLHCPPQVRSHETRTVRLEVLKNRDGASSRYIDFDFVAPVGRFAERLPDGLPPLPPPPSRGPAKGATHPQRVPAPQHAGDEDLPF